MPVPEYTKGLPGEGLCRQQHERHELDRQGAAEERSGFGGGSTTVRRAFSGLAQQKPLAAGRKNAC